MIPIILQKGRQKIKGLLPCSWDEATFSHYQGIKKSEGDIYIILQELSGIDKKTWENTHDSDLIAKLLPFIKWALAYPDLKNIEMPEFIFVSGKAVQIPKKLSFHSWNQKLIAQSFITSSKDIDQFFLDLISVYLAPEFFGKKYDEVDVSHFKTLLNDCIYIDLLKCFDFIHSEVTKLIMRDKKYLKSTITSEQTRAGIDKVSKLGLITILDPLAGGNVLNYDSVLQTPYETIFNKLVYDHEVSQYQKRYNEVMSKQKQVKAK